MLFPLITLMTNLKQFKSHFGGSPSLLSSTFLLHPHPLALPYSSFPLSYFYRPPFACFSRLPLSFFFSFFFLVKSGFHLCLWLHVCMCVLQQAAHLSVLNIQSEAWRAREREKNTNRERERGEERAKHIEGGVLRRCYTGKHMQQQEADWCLLKQIFLRGRACLDTEIIQVVKLDLKGQNRYGLTLNTLF